MDNLKENSFGLGIGFQSHKQIMKKKNKNHKKLESLSSKVTMDVDEKLTEVDEAASINGDECLIVDGSGNIMNSVDLCTNNQIKKEIWKEIQNQNNRIPCSEIMDAIQIYQVLPQVTHPINPKPVLAKENINENIQYTDDSVQFMKSRIGAFEGKSEEIKPPGKIIEDKLKGTRADDKKT